MPHNIFHGWSEHGPAVRHILSRVSRTVGKRRKRRAKSVVAKVKRAVRKRMPRGMAHMVKGSAAAKSHMAKLRKLAVKARKK